MKRCNVMRKTCVTLKHVQLVCSEGENFMLKVIGGFKSLLNFNWQVAAIRRQLHSGANGVVNGDKLFMGGSSAVTAGCQSRLVLVLAVTSGAAAGNNKRRFGRMPGRCLTE
jgi:hypothetical protein